MTDLTRRSLGFAAGALAATPALAQRSRSVDLNDPLENLRAYVRMRGDLSGRTVIERVEARTMGAVERQLPKPLYAAIGIQVSRFRPTEEGFALKFKYFSLTTDVATGAPLTVFDNPYTGARNPIPPRLNDNPEIVLTTQGWRFPNRPKDPSAQKNPGVVRPWARLGDQLSLTDTLVSPPRYENHPAFQSFTYLADYAAATDPCRAAVPSSFAGTGMENWRDWMEIKEDTGSLVVHMVGHKVRGRADFPDWLVDGALKADPKIFEDL